MSIILAILIAATAYGAYRLAQNYVRYSMVSFDNAARVRGDMVDIAKSFLSDANGIPESVARAVIGVVAITGCGCFIRGMMISHYLPAALSRSNIDPTTEAIFAQVESLDSAKRDLLSKFIITAIVYDSFRNPLQGWFFRWMLFSLGNNNAPTFVEKMEAKATAFSVLSKRPVPAF